jgi:hypothetical protein
MSTYSRRSSSSAMVSEQPYALASVTRADPPPEAEPGDWHCYVITQGENQIVGRRLGSAESVRSAALLLVEKLNDRRTVRNGRSNLTLGAKAP